MAEPAQKLHDRLIPARRVPLHGGLARVRRRYARAFLAPLLLVLLAVAAWPLLRTIWFSFTDAHLSVLDDYVFIGLENFVFLVEDPLWWRAVRNTLVFAFVSVALELALGLGIALVLDAHLPGRGTLRAAVLVPWAIPTIVSAQMWAWMYNDLYGVINHLLLGLGMIAEPYAWTADPALALGAIIAVDVWKTTPFVTLLLLAALQLVPRELYEAARVDGVSPLKVLVRVTLPLIAPALVVVTVFRLLDALRVFDLIYVLTPNSEYTMSMSIYARQQLIEFQDVGYGSAAASLLFVVIAVMIALFLTLVRTRVLR